MRPAPETHGGGGRAIAAGLLSVALLLSDLGLRAAQAGGPVDPDWPCVQRRQPSLSLGQVWPGPQPDAAVEAKAGDKAIRDLGTVLALRRTSLDEAGQQIAEFAATADDQALIALYLLTFNQIQSQRDRVMAGITRYAHKQEALEGKINDLRHQFNAASSAANPDFDALDKMEADLDWMTRIFTDRQQSLTYVCETPVILEQRAFALGRLIAARM